MSATPKFLLIFILTISLFFNPFTETNAIESSSDDPLIIFESIHVDENPVPYEPFNISATISTTSRHSDLFLYLKVPSKLSILSPIVSDLDASRSGVRTASWIVLASEAGSFPIDIVATSNSPPETTTFQFDLSVGTAKSLVVTELFIPGDLFERETFQIGIKLKNSGIINDTNLLSYVSIPDGLQLKSSGSIKQDTLGPKEEIILNWDMTSQKPGSFPIVFYFSSRNSGLSFVDAYINIGSPVSADISPVQFYLGGINSTSATIFPGETNLPIVVTLKNTGNTRLYEISAELELNTPFLNGSFQSNNNTNGKDYLQVKKFWLGQLSLEQSRDAVFLVDVGDVSPDIYTAILNVYYSDGGNEYSSSFDFLVKVSKSPLKITTITLIDPPAYAGDDLTELDIEILNTGSILYDVDAKLILPNGFSPSWGNSDKEFIGIIGPYERTSVKYFFNIDNKVLPGEYQFSILFSTDQAEQSVLDLDFLVDSKALFKVIDVDDSQIYKGATNVPFKITLQNIGSDVAENVNTKLLGGNTIPGVKSTHITTVGNEEIIGNVLPGEKFTTTFFVSIDPEVESGDLSTFVEILWEKNTEENFSENVNIQFTLSPGPSYLLIYNGIPIIYLIILGVIIVGLFYFAMERKKKMLLLNSEEN